MGLSRRLRQGIATSKLRLWRRQSAPGVAAYLPAEDGGYRLHTLQVMTVAGDRIARVTVFQDPEVFAAFALPPTLP